MRYIKLLILCILFSTSLSAQKLTYQLWDLNPINPSEPYNFAIYNNKLFFKAFGPSGFALWIKDGSNAPVIFQHVVPISYIYYNKLLYYTVEYGTNSMAQLYHTDGTTSGTQVLNVCSGVSILNNSELIVYNGLLYFTAVTAAAGRELWVTDGTTINTHIVKDINPGANPSFPGHYFEFNGKIYFTANDGVNGAVLWATDGTATGTTKIKDVDFASPIVYKGKLYFIGSSSQGSDLWVTDGTTAGTHLVVDMNSSSASGSIIQTGPVYNGKLYFTGGIFGVSGNEVWYTDGTATGTKMLKDIGPGPYSSEAKDLTIFNNKLYFSATDSATGRELWVSDGTTAGTKQLADINAGINSSYPGNLKVYKNHLYFIAQSPSFNAQMYVTDGTAAGTKEIEQNSWNNALGGTEEIYEYQGSLYFGAQYNRIDGRELWQLTDTAYYTNSTSVTNINPIAFTIYPNPGHGNVFVTIPAEAIGAVFTLYDITGKDVYNCILTQASTALQLSKISAGAYISTINNNGATGTQRIIIE